MVSAQDRVCHPIAGPAQGNSALGRAAIAGLASASTTTRPGGAGSLTIMALTGSRCSDSASTTNSLDRCIVRPVEVLPPSAFDVLTPHDVLALIPSVSATDSDSPYE